MMEKVHYMIAEAMAAVLVMIIKAVAFAGYKLGLCNKLETIDGDDPVFDVDWMEDE